nr:hypothetical protein GCM10020093_009770 [Planobispora longispora]
MGCGRRAARSRSVSCWRRSTREGTALAYTTVQTVADRLARKGLLTRSRSGVAFVYAPVRTREEHVVAVMLAALSDLPDRGPVLARFAESVEPGDAQRLLDALTGRSSRPGEDG